MIKVCPDCGSVDPEDPEARVPLVPVKSHLKCTLCGAIMKAGTGKVVIRTIKDPEGKKEPKRVVVP